MKRSYSELITLDSFEERFEYLALGGSVGDPTFGDLRYLNQRLYNSSEWKRVRHTVILRDNACDLGILGRDIFDKIYVHHMNPLTVRDFELGAHVLLNPEFLICTSFDTHQAITFGDKNKLFRLPTERRKGDTAPWRVY